MQTAWQQQNLTAITRRLAAVKRLPAGILFERKSQYNHIIVRKTSEQLLLCYRHERHRTEEVESRLDPENPLVLLSDYTQAMLLALAWQSAPQRVLLLGLGGGRLQMVLHHYLEHLELYTVELDPLVVEVAQRFFAWETDPRQHLTVKDGRDYLRGFPTEAPYDVILLDAFQVSGIPVHLCTREFFAECRENLTPEGFVATNLHISTSIYDSIRKTFAAAFRSTTAFRLLGGNVVVVGSEAERLTLPEIRERIAAVQERYGFNFALPELARREASGASYRQSAPILRDAYTSMGEMPPPTTRR
jgi:spermidine synthase